MPRQGKTVLVIACGAIAREIHQIKCLNQWDHVELQAIDAELHFTPERIAPAVRKKLIKAQDVRRRNRYKSIFVAFADCGTYGQLDEVIAEFGVQRLPGLHCYATFAGQTRFEQLQDVDPGTFYLTDFLVQHFERLVVGFLKLDAHPELIDQFFGNYNCVVYLAQTRGDVFDEQARAIAAFLGLDYVRIDTGFGELRPELEKAVGA